MYSLVFIAMCRCAGTTECCAVHTCAKARIRDTKIQFQWCILVPCPQVTTTVRAPLTEKPVKVSKKAEKAAAQLLKKAAALAAPPNPSGRACKTPARLAESP